MSQRLNGTSAGQMSTGYLLVLKEREPTRVTNPGSSLISHRHSDFDRDLEGLLYNSWMTGKEIAVENV